MPLEECIGSYESGFFCEVCDSKSIRKKKITTKENTKRVTEKIFSLAAPGIPGRSLSCLPSILHLLQLLSITNKNRFVFLILDTPNVLHG